MGATLSLQQDRKCEEDEEPHSGPDEVPEDSTEPKENNGKISSRNGKTQNLTDEMNSHSEERDLVDAESVFVTLKEDDSDTTDSIQADVSQTSTENITKQMNNTDDIIAKKENDTNDKLNDTEIGFKKIFRFGGLKFTLKKDKAEKIDADEPVGNKHDRNASGPSGDSWDTVDVNHVSTNEQIAEEIKNERMGGDANAEHMETHPEMAVDKISEPTEHGAKELVEDVPQSPEPEEPMSPIKRFFLQGLLASLKKKRTEEEMPKQNEDELKCLDKVVEKDTAKDATTCTCLNVSNGTFDEDKNIQLFKKEEYKPAAEGDVITSLEDKVQASPFKRLFRKLSTRRQSETKLNDTNLLEPGENISENPQLSTELVKSQNEQDTKVFETQTVDELMDTSHEESRKKSDSAVSWENLICVRSAKTRTRKTSDSEDETQDKGEVPKRTTESPFESSTEGDHLTSSNEQGASPAEEDSGSTWKSFKKLVTPKRKSRMEESGSVEQMQSDTEINKDESSCSIRKLISGRKKIKPDGQQENMSSDEGSKGTGTDIEDDETPGVVPLSEYESAKYEPEILNVIADEKIESSKEKNMQPRTEQEQPEQIHTLYIGKPLCFDAGPPSVPVPTEYMEELTEFLSKHQQLSDIPEEGLIEESVATPVSFVEWTTKDDTLADDTIDMTADAVTAPEHISEHNEDETTEMVSAVSQLSESPKTSGTGTPISPIYDGIESAIILQKVVESMSMVPSVLSITTEDEVPEALAVAVSQFIVESTTTTETKVFVTHKKEEATSIFIGIVSQEIKAAEVALPLPLVEGISEITHSVATELVLEDLAEESKTAGVTTDNVHEAEITETNTMLYEVLLIDEQSTTLAETARKSKQQVVMAESIQEEVSSVIQMEDVEDDLTELLNGTHEVTPVHAVVHGGSLLLEEQITLNMTKLESEGPLQPTSEKPVCEQLALNTQILFEREHIIPDVESSAADIKQLSVVAVTTVATSAVELLPDREGRESELSTVAREGTLTVAITNNKEQAIKEPEDMSKVFLGFEKDHTETDISVEEDCKTKQTAEDEIYMVTLKTETGKETNKPPAMSEQQIVYEEVSEDETQAPAADNSKSISQPTFSNVITDIQATAVAPGYTEENASKTEATKRLCVEDELGKCFVDEEEHKETAKLEINPEITPEQEMVEIFTTFPEVEASQEPYDLKNQTEEAIVKMTESSSTVTLRYEEETGVVCNISEQPVRTPLCYTGIDRVGSLEEVERCVDDRAVKSDTLSSEKKEDNGTAKPEVETEIIPENQEAIETVKTSLKVELQRSTEQLQKEILSRKPEESQVTTSSHEAYHENNQVTGTAEITEAISSVIFEEESEMECKISDQLVETGQCFDREDRVPINTMEQITEILPKDKAGFQEGLQTEGSEHVKKVIKPSTYLVSPDVISEHVAEMNVGSEQNLVYPAVTEEEVVSERAVTKKSLEMTAALKVQEDTTTMELVAESHIGTENKSESEALTQVESELQTKTEIVTESKEDIIVASEAQAETSLVSSLLTELEVETQVVQSAVNCDNIQALGLASVINKCESDMQSFNEPHISTDTTLQESPAEISGRQTETESSLVETAALFSILKEVSEKEDVNIHKPVILKETESKLETCMLTEEISYTVPVLDVETVEASTIQSETVVRTCVEKNLEVQGSVVSSVKEDTDLESIVLTTTVNEAQLNTVIPVVQTLVEQTVTDLPAMQDTPVGQLSQEPEMSNLAQEVKEPNLETKDAFDANALKVAMKKETRGHAWGVSEQIIEVVVLTSAVPELELTSEKEDMGSSVFTVITEEPKMASCLKLPTTSVTLVVQTPAMISEEVQRPCVTPVVETPAVTSAVPEGEMTFAGLEIKERLCDSQAADNTEVKQPPLTETEIKVTETIHQVTQDVANTANCKDDSNNPQETSGKLNEVSIPTVKLVETLPGTDDDVWEDAVHDIHDDQCSSTEASGGLHDTAMDLGDK